MGRDGFISLVLPSVTLGLAITSVYVRLLRSSLIDSLSHEFIRAARSRGFQKYVSSLPMHFAIVYRRSLPYSVLALAA